MNFRYTPYHLVRLTLFFVILNFSFIGCNQSSKTILPPSVPSEKIYLHTVNYTGENLPMIAEWYTGSYKNWKNLQTYNGHVRPFALNKNSVIRIPGQLTTQTIPMTQEFVTKKKKAYVARTKKPDSNNTIKNEITTPTATQTAEPVTPTPLVEPTDNSIEVDEAPMQDELIKNLLQN